MLFNYTARDDGTPYSVREARVSDRELLEDRIKSLEKQGKLDQKELQRLYETVYDLSMDLDKAGSDIKSHQVTLAKTAEQLQQYQKQAERYHEAEAKVTETLGELDKSIYGSAMEGNIAQDLSILGKLPYAKDLVNMLAGYKASNMSLDAFKNLINVGNIWMETYKLSNGLMENATDATYNGKMTTWGKIYKTMQAASQLTGLPVYNVTRDVVALWNTIMNGTRDDWKILTYDPYKLSQEMVTSYDEHLADLGISKRAFRNMIKGMDVTGDRRISQDEALAYLQNEENLGTLTHEQAVAVWATIAGVNNWKKEYEMLSSDWTLSESRYNRYKSDVAPTGVDMDYYQQILTAMDANENNNYSQSEAGPYLKAEEAAGRLTHEQAVAIWNAITTGKTSYDAWLDKNK